MLVLRFQLEQPQVMIPRFGGFAQLLRVQVGQRKVGARGLRMILEDLMLELMYHLPMQRKVREFVVSAEMVRTREINWSLLEKAG